MRKKKRPALLPPEKRRPIARLRARLHELRTLIRKGDAAAALELVDVIQREQEGSGAARTRSANAAKFVLTQQRQLRVREYWNEYAKRKPPVAERNRAALITTRLREDHGDEVREEVVRRIIAGLGLRTQ